MMHSVNNGSLLAELRAIHKSYGLGKARVRALEDIYLDIRPGDFIALEGPSGSGKSTLLNLIGCIDKPDEGQIILDGEDVTTIPLHKLAAVRSRKLGFIFQSFNLLSVLTAFENVEYPLLFSGLDRSERRARVRQWLQTVGLEAQARQKPDQLSGGQRQRVAIARAMIGNPRLVLADEPTANLDSHTATEILDVLKRLNQEIGTTFIFATHDPRVVERADRVLTMRDGSVLDEERLLSAKGGLA